MIDEAPRFHGRRPSDARLRNFTSQISFVGRAFVRALAIVRNLNMFRATTIAAVALAAFWVMPAQAKDVTVGSLKISAPWARATPKGAAVGGGYLKITNTGTAPDRLIGGSSNIAARCEVHEMSMENGVMKMRMLPHGVEIKPGQTVEFKPGGYHLMFKGLKQQLKKGGHVKSTLVFEKAGKVEVDFAIEGLGAVTGGGDHALPGMSHDQTQMKH
jgi:periplasmic copper chaperone A